MFKKLTLTLGVLAGLSLYGSTPIHAEDADKVEPTKEYVVNDYAGILDDKTKQQVIDNEKRFKETKNKPQVVVMTVKSTDGQSIADWSDDLLMRDDWKFGKKGQDNGVLILFAQNKGQNNVRISTGYGVEDILTDQQTHDILMKSYDDLKSKDVDKVNDGIRQVDRAVNKILMKRYANEKDPDKNSDDDSLSTGEVIALIVIIGIAAFALTQLIKSIGGGSNGGSNGGSGNELFTGFTLGSLFSSGSSSSSSSWGGGSSWSDSGSFSDSGGGGDFGGGGSDI